jgi:hypothetical protein
MTVRRSSRCKEAAGTGKSAKTFSCAHFPTGRALLRVSGNPGGTGSLYDNALYPDASGGTAFAPSQTGAISNFESFLTKCWRKAPVVQPYSICGGGWLGPKWHHFNRGEAWACHSLKEAFEKYFWNGRNYESNKKELDGLKIYLTECMKARDDRRSANVICDIFKWGGTNRNDENRRWTDRRAHRGTLCRAIDEGVRLLKDSNASASLDRFNGCDLRMNSSFAKVYALADRDGSLIIYDGRVGAALGHLV